MARRKSRRHLITGVATPEDVAGYVIRAYVSKAGTEVGKWETNYRTKVIEYTGDRTKQAEARVKLANWYNVFLSLVYPRLKQVYGEAQAEYIRSKAMVPAPAPAPAPKPLTVPA
jgi:hypothetical protein